MNKKKVNKTFPRTPLDQEEKQGFFKRFAMLFESTFIVLITAASLYATRYVDVPEFVMQLSSYQQIWPLTELMTVVGISLVGLLVLFMRYSAHLRRKFRQQLNGAEKVKRLAFFDPLTNLPNKALCHDRLEHAMAHAAENNTSVGVIFIGIDDFKSVNKKQGNESGDLLLKEVAKRLSRSLSPGDTLARVTGVEFIIILESLSATDNINSIADKLLTKLIKCYRISMQETYITGNVGIAIYPNDGDNPQELIHNADTAMCFAKEQSLNSLAFFSKEMQEQAKNKKKIAENLKKALEKDELSLHYQPIVKANSHEIIGVEALLRWHNKQLGDMEPDVFIPIAEDIGIITKIGDWVLSKACQQNKIWQQQGYPHLVISVNLSAMQFSLNNYASTVGASLAASELEPQFLELEFTENTLMKDVKQSVNQLKKLRDLGVSIALDDFGTGYSSMQYLTKFPLNKLKIDGRFLKHLPESVVDASIVRSITVLAKQLKLHVTAEGVETAEQCQFIEACKIEAIQGYHFSKPLTAEAFSTLLKSPTWQAKVEGPLSNEGDFDQVAVKTS